MTICQAWDQHVVSMLYDVILFQNLLLLFYFFILSSPMINVVTTSSDVTGVTVWLITSNLNPSVLKIEKWKINWKENKMRKKIKKKLSPHSSILTNINRWYLSNSLQMLYIITWSCYADCSMSINKQNVYLTCITTNTGNQCYIYRMETRELS